MLVNSRRGARDESVTGMLRYLLLLGAGLYVALLLGGRGEDLRMGLAGAYDPPPPVAMPVAAPAPVPVAPVAGPVKLASFTPETPVPEGAAVAEAAPADPAPRLMWVRATAANLRDGPSADTAVLGRLTRDEAVTVVAEAPDGWLRVRLEGDGGEGYVAARLLTDSDPAN